MPKTKSAKRNATALDSPYANQYADIHAKTQHHEGVYKDSSLVRDVLQGLSVQRTSFRLYGREHTTSREHGVAQKPSVHHTYTGSPTAQAWNSSIEALATSLSELYAPGHVFDIVVVNHYEQGASIGKHSDDEKDLDPTAPIISVSVGNDTTFCLAPIAKPAKGNRKSVCTTLSDGDVFVMQPGLQGIATHWTRPLKQGERWSLVFFCSK